MYQIPSQQLLYQNFSDTILKTIQSQSLNHEGLYHVWGRGYPLAPSHIRTSKTVYPDCQPALCPAPGLAPFQSGISRSSDDSWVYGKGYRNGAWRWVLIWR